MSRFSSNKEKILKPSGVMGPLQLFIYRKPLKKKQRDANVKV